MSDIDISREMCAEVVNYTGWHGIEKCRELILALRAALDAAEAALAMEVSRGQHRNNERLEALNCNSTQASKIGQLMVKLDAAEADKRQAVLDELERCAAKVERDQWPTFGDSRRIAAAIRNQGEPK